MNIDHLFCIQRWERKVIRFGVEAKPQMNGHDLSC